MPADKPLNVVVFNVVYGVVVLGNKYTKYDIEPAGSVLDGIKVNDPFPAHVSFDEVTTSVKPKMEAGIASNPTNSEIRIHFFIAEMNFING